MDIMHRTQSIAGIKGQGHGWSKGQICLIGYNFWSNCHRDFKLGSYFSLWKAAPNMILTFDLDLKKFTQVQKFWNISVKEIFPKYASILCTGHNLLLVSKVKVKVDQKVKFT